MTWYRSDADLPDIDDYDIIRGKRTYRYFDGEVDYPFGYGLTYTSFTYQDLSLRLEDEATIEVNFMLTNDGAVASDEVVQLYAVPPKSRVPKPIKQLLSFKRIHGIQPGESRAICLTAPVSDLFFYDTVSGTQMVEEGEYQFFVGPSSADRALTGKLCIPGTKTGVRDTAHRIRADHFDDCENIELTEGAYGYTAVQVKHKEKEARIVFRDCALTQNAERLRIGFKSAHGCRLEVLIDGERAALFEGDIETYTAHVHFRENSIQEGTPMPERWPALYIEWETFLPEPLRVGKERAAVEIKVHGDVRLLYWVVVEAGNYSRSDGVNRKERDSVKGKAC